MGRDFADSRTCRREGDDQFAFFVHNAEWPDGAIEGFVFAFQDATLLRVKEGALNFFFGGCGKIRAKDNLPAKKLPHHAVFVGLTQLFDDLGREKRGFPEALTPKGAAELAGGALFFGEDGGKH